MISEQDMHDALSFLVETDEKHAELFANVERMEERAKQVKGAMFLLQSGTIPEREAKALNSPEYNVAVGAHWTAVEVFRGLDNKRKTKTICIEAWRSLNANRRQG